MNIPLFTLVFALSLFLSPSFSTARSEDAVEQVAHTQILENIEPAAGLPALQTND